MGFDITDVVGLGEPAKKLIEVVSAGIGTYFRPGRIRREADAKAYEIKTLAAADADAKVIEAAGQSKAALERITVLAAENPELLERAKNRLLAREIEGQLNVEAIAEQALKALPNSVSSAPIAEDWRRRFFQEAENICDQDLQTLWGKVLAGEVASPGSYSLRTLEVLKHLSRDEAERFRVVCSLAYSDGWTLRPGRDINVALAPYGLTYNDLMSLRDAGLLVEGDTLVRNYDFQEGDTDPRVVLLNNGVYMELSGPAVAHAEIPSLPFTRAGKELQRLIEAAPNYIYLKAVATFLGNRGITVKKGEFSETQPGQGILIFDQEF